MAGIPTPKPRGCSTLCLPIDKDRTVIQAWLGSSSVSRLANSGYKVLASPYTSWYLDCGTGGWLGGGLSWCDPYKTWQTIYDYNPLAGVDPQNTANVIGGEVCAWAETIDDTNIDEKLWPRSCAAAERLWSATAGGSALALNRINAQRELLVRRGLNAYPLQQQWCNLNPGMCVSGNERKQSLVETELELARKQIELLMNENARLRE